MIDLSKKSTELYKIKLEDGTILKLKKPTQAMLVTMMEMSKAQEELEVLNELFSLITRIFNRNVNNMTFTQEEIEEMLDLEIAMEIVQDYLNSTLKELGK